MKDSLSVSLINKIPLGLRRLFAQSLAGVFFRLSLKHRLITLHNLMRSFPEKSTDEILQIGKDSCKSFALVAAEFCDIAYLNKENLHKYIDVKGLDNYAAARGEEKGVLLFGAHFGNWEIGNAALAVLSMPVVFIYRILDSKFLEKNITAVRASCGNTSLSKENAMRPMIRLLNKGQTISLLIDQNVAWYGGVFVDFFGRPACTTSGLALLALQTGAPVLPAFTHRLPSGKYQLEIGPKIEIIRTGNRHNDVLLNTQNFTNMIEDKIRRHPSQWFWMHQRWKTKIIQSKARG